MRTLSAFLVSLITFFYGCRNFNSGKQMNTIYLGADLSYLNEMVDCGGMFRSEGEIVEPYAYFASRGANIVRVRLWHTPRWTRYSTLDDVKRTILESKKHGMEILLDFHYSDTWADPQKQLIPDAWKGIMDIEVLGDSLYNYTLDVLLELKQEDLLPGFVQVGNEVNSEILMELPAALNGPINWTRNAYLLNRGIEAVRDASEITGKKIQLMLHIAQPENALWWFDAATKNGVTDFDWIGLSYYPKWSEYGINDLAAVIDSLSVFYRKRLMIVETAYPYSQINVDSAGNILKQDALIPGYPATPMGQLEFMRSLTEATLKGGGEGVIYWEPAWISTPCSTLWGQGSHWENATFFDAGNNNEALPVFSFLEL